MLSPGAVTVGFMTTHDAPQSTPEPRVCDQCSHAHAVHVLIMVVENDPAPMGLVICPEPGCECAATWRAGTGPSTPEQIAETRMLVRAQLLADGYPVPTFLLQ